MKLHTWLLSPNVALDKYGENKQTTNAPAKPKYISNRRILAAVLPNSMGPWIFESATTLTPITFRPRLNIELNMPKDEVSNEIIPTPCGPMITAVALTLTIEIRILNN